MRTKRIAFWETKLFPTFPVGVSNRGFVLKLTAYFFVVENLKLSRNLCSKSNAAGAVLSCDVVIDVKRSNRVDIFFFDCNYQPLLEGRD